LAARAASQPEKINKNKHRATVFDVDSSVDDVFQKQTTLLGTTATDTAAIKLMTLGIAVEMRHSMTMLSVIALTPFICSLQTSVR